MAKKRKKFFQNILLLIFTIIATWMFIEIMLIFFFPQNLNITQLDADKVFELKPGISSILERQEFTTHVKINSHGFRDNEFEFKKPKDTTRIAFVGDSFVFGYGVELNETMVKILENKLNSGSNENYEVLNFGISAYGTEQEYLLIKDDVLRYSPDIILLAFSLNDIKENVKFNLFGMENNTLVRNPPQKITPILKLRNYVSWHSHLYSLIYFSVIDNQKLRNLLIKIKLLNPPSKDPSTDFNSLIYLNLENQDFDYAVNKTLLLLNKINNVATQNKAKLIVFMIPSKEQVDSNKMKDFIRNKNLDIDKLNITKVQKILKPSLWKNSIRIIEPLNKFRKHNTNNTFYYDIDGHWINKGQELAADITYEYLINNDYTR
jgi:hypothetical protein